MKDVGNEIFVVFDNGGKTADRYTVIYFNGEYVGMSEKPFHPQGFCQHGEGASFAGYKLHNDEIEVSFWDLPEDCQQMIREDINCMTDGLFEAWRKP